MALIAHWPLDGRLDDISGNGYHLTNKDASICEDSRLGKCYEVDRTKYVEYKNFKTDFTKRSFSLCFWYKINVNVETGRNMLFYLGGGDTGGYHMLAHQDKFHSACWNAGSTGGPDSFQYHYKKNEWVHYTIVVDADSRIQMEYENGVLLHTYIFRNRDWVRPTDGICMGSSRVHNGGSDKIIRLCDFRIYDHVLNSNEITNIYNEPYIDLDFKGTIPPTVNWLDSTNKVLLYDPVASGGYVDIINPNYFRVKKQVGTQNAVHFKPMFSKFTLSFKIKILDGALINIGGHGKPDGINQATPSQVKVVIDDCVLDSWSTPYVFSTPKLRGNIIRCQIMMDLDTPPVWENSYGLLIQPNRLLSELIICDIYDVQIEEGLIATPFCTWSRDYMEIPDKSSYRKNISSDSRNMLTLPTFKQNSISTVGSKSSLYFTKENSLCLKDVKPLPTMTVLMSLRISDIEFDNVDVNKLSPIFSIAKINSTAKDPGRIYLLYNSQIRKLVLFHESSQYIVEFEVVGLEDLFISIRFSNSSILISVGDKIFNTGFNNNPIEISYDIILGKRNPNTISNYSFEISDFKILPYILTDQEVLQEYNKLKNRVKSFTGAFDNIPTLSTEVPRLWERNPNTIGIDCFANNPNIPQTQAIPIGWGGSFKQPDSSIFSAGSNMDICIVQAPEIIIIENGGSLTQSVFVINDDQNEAQNALDMITKSKFN